MICALPAAADLQAENDALQDLLVEHECEVQEVESFACHDAHIGSLDACLDACSPTDESCEELCHSDYAEVYVNCAWTQALIACGVPIP